MKLLAKDLTLNEAEVELLRAVDGGARSFEPNGDSEDALAAFQEKTKSIRKLEACRYIAEINGLNMVRFGGKNAINKVRLRGGLTEKGKAVLAHYNTTDVRELEEQVA